MGDVCAAKKMLREVNCDHNLQLLSLLKHSDISNMVIEGLAD